MTNVLTLETTLNFSGAVQTFKKLGFNPIDVGLSVGAAWIAGQDRSMWRTLRPSAGQAQQ